MPATEAPSTDVIVHGTRLPLTERARDRWDQESLQLLAASKAQGASAAMLFTLAELSSRYDLDPWANEIWVANMGGRDGGTGALAIMVGRDGYMKIAKRDRTFVACAGQAVYEHDEIDVEIDETGGLSKFRFKAAHPAKRGEPQGAFAILKREGKPSLYFFAPLSQFKRGGGAWKYEDAMIVKCAQSYLLRTTYNVSGPAPADELMVGFDPKRDTDGTAVEESPLPDRLAALFERAAKVDRLSWRRTELEARIFDEKGELLLDEVRRMEKVLEEWLDENEPADAEAEAEGEGPQDADVVAHGEEAPPIGEEAAPPPGEEFSIQPLDPDTVTEKWHADAESEWRQRAEVLIHRRDELDARAGDVGPEHARDVMDELEQIETTLEQELGIPRGWRPPAQPDTLL